MKHLTLILTLFLMLVYCGESIATNKDNAIATRMNRKTETTNPAQHYPRMPTYVPLWYVVNDGMVTIYSDTEFHGEVSAVDNSTGETIFLIESELSMGYSFEYNPNQSMTVSVIDANTGEEYYCII